MKKTKAIDLLDGLFNHITKPSDKWPQTRIGKKTTNETVWYTGGVGDEFRDYLVHVEKFLKLNKKQPIKTKKIDKYLNYLLILMMIIIGLFGYWVTIFN